MIDARAMTFLAMLTLGAFVMTGSLASAVVHAGSCGVRAASVADAARAHAFVSGGDLPRRRALGASPDSRRFVRSRW